jgi:hypothetical protein
MIIKNIGEAIENTLNIIEIENLAIFTGSEVKFSNFNAVNMKKIFISFQNALNNIAFDFGLKEIEINDSKIILIFKQNDRIILIKTIKNLVNKPLIEKSIETIFNFLTE